MGHVGGTSLYVSETSLDDKFPTWKEVLLDDKFPTLSFCRLFLFSILFHQCMFFMASVFITCFC